jgi:H+/Cl- antiporter ClcA
MEEKKKTLTTLDIILIIVGIIVLFFSVLFIWAATSVESKTEGSSGTNLCIGIVGIIIGIALIAIAKYRHKKEVEIIQKIDLPGDLSLENLKCKMCSAPLNKDSVEVKEGAIFIHCPYCGALYQIEEEPKF